jgi:Glyoxalase-like domain
MVNFQVTVDCADPDLMARFWAPVLGYQLEAPPDGFDSWRAYWRSRNAPEEELDDGYESVVDPDGHGPRIWFQQVPEKKSVKNRLHFDLDRGGGRGLPLHERRARVDAAVEDLLRAGATRVKVVDAVQQDHYFVLMQDPEGNEFCVR